MSRAKTLPSVLSNLLSSDIARIGFVIGVAMPLLSAALYPLYYHQMSHAWQEWTRLLELPFVACELVIIAVARNRGMDARVPVERIFRQHPWAIGLFLFGLFASSLAISKLSHVSTLMSLITLIHLWFGLAIFYLAHQVDDVEWDKFIGWLAIGLVPLALLTAWKFNFPPPRSNGPDGAIEWHAALPGFISVRHFGSWTAGVATAVLARFLFTRDARGRTWWLAGYALAVMLTIWSGTRAGIVTLLVVPSVMALYFGFRSDRARLVSVCAVSAFAAAIAALLVPDAPQFFLYTAGDAAGADAAVGGRLQLWQSTYLRWLDSPLLGWGTGSTFWEVDLNGWAHTQPHNFVLQFLISWGAVGGLAAMVLLAKGGILLLKEGARHDRLMPLLALTMSMLLLSLQEGMLHYPRFIMLSMIGFAAFAARARPVRVEPAIPAAQAALRP